VDAYKEAIKRFEELGDKRSTATSQERLGTTRMYQSRYSEALMLYEQARKIFETLNDMALVAGIWHKMGIVNRRTGYHQRGEETYKKALAIHVQQGNRSGEASVLNELGNLYDDMDRLEDAVVFYGRSGDIYAQLEDRLEEGKARSNTAIPLIRLKRYDQARRELERALQCKASLGDVAQPWKTWDILYHLELLTGNQETANAAKKKALQTYLSYRKAGGESQSPIAEIFRMVSDAIRQGRIASMIKDLPEILERNADPHTQNLIPKLQSILNGNRDQALVDTRKLLYMDAAELQFLLDELKS